MLRRRLCPGHCPIAARLKGLRLSGRCLAGHHYSEWRQARSLAARALLRFIPAQCSGYCKAVYLETALPL